MRGPGTTSGVALSLSVLKTLGYAVSTLSVLLLAVPSWKAASEHPPLLLALIGGLAASILGMILRWLSFLREQKLRRDP